MIEQILKWLELDYKAIHGTNDTNYMFCCPFHTERHPSCGISETKLIGRCFSCGETFHLTKLISHIKGFTLTQSINYVSEKFNITKEVVSVSLRRYEDIVKKEENLKPITYLAKYSSGKIKSDYLASRGFDEKDIKEFQIGYDTKLHRVTIPIFNRFNKLMGIVGRSVNNAFPKYKVYNFSVREALYPLHKLEIENRTLILVEGLLDVIWMYKLGFKNVLSVISAGITDEQVALLKTLDIDKIVLALDNDEAGKKAQMKIYNLLKKDFKIDVIDYGDIKDFQGQTLETINKILQTRKAYITKKLKRMV